MKKVLLLSFLVLTTTTHAALLSPTAVRLKIFKFAVSSSPNCSSPITVVDNGSTPTYVDFKGNPSLGSGTLGSGTYPCVIIEFSDRIEVTSEAGGSCTTTPFTQDLCGDGTSSQLVSGSTANCTTAGEDRIAMYLSTASTATGAADAFNPPNCNTAGCTATLGFNLGAALVVSGTSAGTFTVNADNKICGGNNYDGNTDCTQVSCELLPPDFTFTEN